MKCTEIIPVVACYNGKSGCQNAVIHYEYGEGASGPIIVSVRITDILGVVIPGADATNTSVGACVITEHYLCATDGDEDGIKVLANRCGGEWGSAENVQNGHPDIGKVYAAGEWKFASDECNCIKDCCDTFCGNKWINCDGECINWVCE